MNRRAVRVSAVAVVVLAAAGSAGAVTVATFPQPVTIGTHEVTTGDQHSVDARTTVYSGADVAGYDVTVRNDGSTQLSVNVTVRMLTLDGTQVASASKEGTVLTGATATLSIRFDAAVATSAYDRVVVEATAA